MPSCIFNDTTPSKISVKEVIEDGIDIYVNDEHPSKALLPIEVTEEGINISVNEIGESFYMILV